MKKDIRENSSSLRLFSRLKTSKQFNRRLRVFDEMIAILPFSPKDYREVGCGVGVTEGRGWWLFRGVCKRLKNTFFAMNNDFAGASLYRREAGLMGYRIKGIEVRGK